MALRTALIAVRRRERRLALWAVNASVFSFFLLIETPAGGYDARSAFSARRRPAHAPTE
jgi:hypothetical protein